MINKLFDKYNKMAEMIIKKNYATQKKGSHYDDLLQEARIAIYNGLKKYDYSKGGNNIYYYLKRCINSTVKEYLRKSNIIVLPQNKTRKKDDCNIVIDYDYEIDNLSYNNDYNYIDNEMFLNHALNLLSEKEKSVISDIYKYDMSITEIALRDKVSKQYISNINKKAIKKLQKHIKI